MRNYLQILKKTIVLKKNKRYKDKLVKRRKEEMIHNRTDKGETKHKKDKYKNVCEY